MSKMRIYCLGDFRVEIDGEIISGFTTEKTRALLAYLSVEAGKPIRRSFLAGLLWSDDPDERALQNLRQTLSYLRKTIGDNQSSCPFIIADRDTIQLNPSADIWVDTTVFKQSLNRAYQYYQKKNGAGQLNIRWLQRAILLFQGQFLEHFYLSKTTLFDEWISITQENLNLLAIRAFSQVADYHEKRGEYQSALQHNIRITEIFPWDESARIKTIYLLGLENQWSAAQSQFMALKNFQMNQMGDPPSKEVLELMDQINSAASGKEQVKQRIPISKYNLPETGTAFIGRTEETDEIIDLIDSPECRLTTIIGPGGVGKTRLAVEIAEYYVGLIPDGVFFVSMLNATQFNHVVHLLSEAVGLVNFSQVDPKMRLLDYLRSREMLLVLDNFEHLTSDPKCILLLDEILCRAPRISLLVTSREKLSLQNECIYQLYGLEYPPNGSVSLESAPNFDAVSLFLKRVTQAQRNFCLNESNLPDVIRVCQVLDGIPLGIELAVSAVLEFGLENIASRIVQDFLGFTSTAVNTQPRHRNLRAVFDVSWNLLSEEEKEALSFLSIFTGGFDRKAASAICNATPAILSSLTAKSLIRVEEQDRFFIHETIRQFSSEKLIDKLDHSQLRSRHAKYYAAFLAESSESLSGIDQSKALSEISKEFGNACQALNWLVGNAESDTLRGCVDSLYQYFSIRSLFVEGLQWFQQAVHALENENQDQVLLAMLLSRLGSLAYSAREDELSLKSLVQSHEVFICQDEQKELALCKLYLGWYYQRQKDFSIAAEYAKSSLAYFLQSGDELGKSQAYLLLGSIWNRQGNNHEAKEMVEKALESCRKTGNALQMVIVLNRLGDLVCYDGNYDLAVNLFNECLLISNDLNDRYHQAIMLNNLGTIAHLKENYAQAQEQYLASLKICKEIGDRDGIALAYSNLGELATVQRDYPAALDYSGRALEIAEELQEHWTIIVCLNSLGEIYCAVNMLEKSQQLFLRAIQMALDIKGIDLVARVSVNYSRVLQLMGETKKAVKLLQAALAHSSTELDARKKAVTWLTEMKASSEIEIDDQYLEEVVKQVMIS